MQVSKKTPAQLCAEIDFLNAKIARLENPEIKLQQADETAAFSLSLVENATTAGAGTSLELPVDTAPADDNERSPSEWADLLQFMLDASGEGLWYWDVLTGKEWWSAYFRELIGYSEDELLAGYENWASLLHPEDREAVLNIVGRHLEQGITYDIEFRMRTKEQGYRLFRSRGFSQRGLDEQTKFLAGSIQDITELKNIENSVNLSTQLMEKMSEGIILVRQSDGVIVYANPGFEQIYGYDPDELIDKPVSMLNAPD
ncbi:MAG: PAS domain-containing protein [Pseudohongiella sp.]|nr:PAS domain-containing protein [Pseudohongiella sp.]